MGYFKVPDWIIDDVAKHITLPELRMLLFLLRASNKSGVSFYSIPKMAQILGSSPSQVRIGLKRLEQNGYITRNFRKGSSTTYRVHERIQEDTTPSGNNSTPFGKPQDTPLENRSHKEYPMKENKISNVPNEFGFILTI